MRRVLSVLLVVSLLVILGGVSKADAKEFCFGAVGKQCATPDKVKGKKPSPLNIPACSKVEKGKTNCWVSPGSIAHDNCCAKNRNGVMCASETKNDGRCAKEWEAAFQDIKKRQAWYHVYKINESASVSFIPSQRMKKFGGQESKTTANLCASGGTKLLVIHDNGFCCSGKAKRQGNLMVCAQEIVAKAQTPSKKTGEFQKQSQNFLKKSQDFFAKLDQLLKNKGVPPERRRMDNKMMKQPPEKRWPELSAEEMLKAVKLEKQAKEFEQKSKEYEQKAVAQMSKQPTSKPSGQQQVAMKPQPALTPPPQLPKLPEQYRKPAPPQPKIAEQKKPEPQPIASRPKQEEPVTPPPTEPEYKEEEVYPQPQQQPEEPVATTPQCDRGTWSPTFGRCVEEEAPEQAAPPECPAGSHWSPTLQSCQPD